MMATTASAMVIRTKKEKKRLRITKASWSLRLAYQFGVSLAKD
jgi:hypothetical protein